LRVLDAGEYQRLGESQLRRADFRVVAATNRSLSAIKHDLRARFTFHLTIPDLNVRKEDVPLLIRHLLREGARSGVLPEGFAGARPGVDPEPPLWLVRQLLLHRYDTNLRELRTLLWQAMISPEPARRAEPAPAAAPAAEEGKPAEGLTSAQIQRCLDDNNGSIEQAWRALGLTSRFALTRLIKRHNIEVRRRPARRE
jgi:two-component system nitrogen regulation response regulator GlnG/two-component system response regulator HydG